MSSKFTATTLDEAKRFVAGIQNEGYSCSMKPKGSKFLCVTMWDGKQYQKFLSRFKGQAVVRRAAESQSMMETKELI